MLLFPIQTLFIFEHDAAAATSSTVLYLTVYLPRVTPVKTAPQCSVTECVEFYDLLNIISHTVQAWSPRQSLAPVLGQKKTSKKSNKLTQKPKLQ